MLLPHLVHQPWASEGYSDIHCGSNLFKHFTISLPWKQTNVHPFCAVTCDVIHNLGVRSPCDVQELVDVGANGVTLLSPHGQAALRVARVVVDDRFDLLQYHVKSEVQI